MSKHISIIGTDTDIGKTIVSLALLHWFKKTNPFYYKPIQCGTYSINNKKGGDLDWIQSQLPWVKGKNTYFFKTPASPHYAAKKENKIIEPNIIKQAFPILEKSFNLIITESAGGILVPLNLQGETLLETLPNHSELILVCSPYLGTLNHTLLTFFYLKQKNIIPKGFIMVHFHKKKPNIFEDNVKTIQNLTAMSYFGSIPYIKQIFTQQPFDFDLLCQELTSDFQNWSKSKV